MLDHEEKFLFKEEILALANSMAEPGTLDNVEDLLTDVITSPRFDSEVFTLERSLQGDEILRRIIYQEDLSPFLHYEHVRKRHAGY